jgi:hypothetical protein
MVLNRLSPAITLPFTFTVEHDVLDPYFVELCPEKAGQSRWIAAIPGCVLHLNAHKKKLLDSNVFIASQCVSTLSDESTNSVKNI